MAIPMPESPAIALSGNLSDLPLPTLLGEVRRTGWATVSGSLDYLRCLAADAGWEEVTFRRTDPPLTELQPQTRLKARRLSLSARYGLGPQPLHSDGAHLREPPDLVVLGTRSPAKTPTLLIHGVTVTHRVPDLSDALRDGVFLVRNGTQSFFATAISGDVLRYDPGCMIPCDSQSRLVFETFQRALDDVTEQHRWDDPTRLLVIDNAVTLHARAAVAPGDLGRRLYRLAFRTGVPRQ